jgi:cysteine desulfurase
MITKPRSPGSRPSRKSGEEPRAPNLYFDAAATVPMPPEVTDALVRWLGRAGAAAGSAGAREAREMMDGFRRELAVECGFELDGPRAYAVVFTSGASEANAHVIRGAVQGYAAKTNRLPHVVTGAAEHPSVLACCQRLASDGMCQLTVLPVGRAGPGLGAVAPEDAAAALRPNTCLVTIGAASAETGALNDLRGLAAAAHGDRVPFHTDAAQLFGKSAFRPSALGVDAFSASLHKLGGPPGVGLLVLRRSFLEGYDLCPLVHGPDPTAQAGSLRGGALFVPSLAASFAAFRLAMAGRGAKSARVRALRDAVKAGIAARLPCFPLEDHPADAPPSIDGGITPPPRAHNGSSKARRALAAAEKGGRPVVFWIAPADERRALPGTLLLAVRRPGFSAAAARAALEARGAVVGLGSGSAVASMGVPAALQSGALRVSLGDDSTAEGAEELVRLFLEVVTSGACLAAG